MLYLVYLISGIIGVIISVILIKYNTTNQDLQDLQLPVILPVLGLILICVSIVLIQNGLCYKVKCADCGNIHSVYKSDCSKCGSDQVIEIEDTIDSVNINCNEIIIHKNKKKNVCDEDAK